MPTSQPSVPDFLEGYDAFLRDLKARIQSAQIKAATHQGLPAGVGLRPGVSRAALRHVGMGKGITAARACEALRVGLAASGRGC